jgi:polyhydroxybutyrate depolymerase
LLVALHGDGGGVRRVVQAFRAAAAEAGVVLLAPACPRALGCRAASFWKWLETSDHDPAWLGAQIDAVAARFPIDPRRIYAAGYSGGATYLGWYAPAHADRFAAVAYVAGGAAYRPPCPACTRV